jgi:hypothetical protein
MVLLIVLYVDRFGIIELSGYMIVRMNKKNLCKKTDNMKVSYENGKSGMIW